MKNRLVALSIALSALVLMAPLTSQVNTYVNGNVLTANQLNSEFGNIYSTVNNLDNANLTDSANISPAKISASIDGTAISRNGSTGALSVAVDNSTIETNSDQIRVKTLGITTAQIANDAINSDKIAEAAVNSSEIASNAVDTAELANNAVTSDRILNFTIAKVDLAVKTASSSSATSGNVAISSSSGNSVITVSSGTQDLTNVSVTITTNGGPVHLVAISNTGTVDSYFRVQDATGLLDTASATLKVIRGVTTISSHRLDIQADAGSDDLGLNVPPGSIQFIDVPSSGTHTYKLQVEVNNGTFQYLNIRLAAYEL